MRTYKITNIVTGDTYVGATTKSVSERFSSHVQKAKSGSRTYLHRAILKYGVDAFLTEELCSYADTNSMYLDECRLITEMTPSYNMTGGGEGGDTSSSPNYANGMILRSERITGNGNPFFGKTHTDATKESISLKKRGVELSLEHRTNISKGLTGKVPSTETIDKRKKARSGKWKVVDPAGNVVVVDVLSDYCKERGLDPCNLRKTSFGVYTHHKGYKCEKLNNE